MLFYEDLAEVVLVGTSSGGMVMMKVAELERERIARLVFVDALALMHGEKIRDIVAQPVPITTEIATGRSRDETLPVLQASLPPEIAAWAAERFGLHPIAVFVQPVVLKSFWEQPWSATAIWCRQAENPGEAHQRRCAEALGARWYEMDTGHYPMLSEPDALVRLIVEG